MKNELFTCLFLGILFISGCSKNSSEDPDITLPPDIDQDSVVYVHPVGIMHITADTYSAENFILMLQDDEALEVLYDKNERGFLINRPLQISITEAHELQAKFFSVRPVLNVDVYARTPDLKDWFKLATYDSIAGFQLSKSIIPEIKKGTSVLLESGEKRILESDCHFTTNDSLKIVCDDPLYEKIATKNKCNWFLNFDGRGDPEFFERNLLPVHAREAIALISNMTYLFSQKVFEDGLYRLQGQLYDDRGTGNWIDTKELYKRILGPFRFWVKLSVQMGAASPRIFSLSEFLWLGHYHDTTDGDATTTAFHEFGHCLNYDHTSNMTTGDYALFPGFCQKLYKQMCIQKELPVWSSTFLKSKYNKNCYFYDQLVKP